MFLTDSQPRRKTAFVCVSYPCSFLNSRSDPVIEPMLQSIPDPFDSYGPPQAEDQIFSILQPLSISVNAPSPSPTPMDASPPDTAKPDDNKKDRNAWSPSNGEYFPAAEISPQWADVPFPPMTSSTPPRSASPPISTTKRRQSHPPLSGHQSKKSGSKLKTVLPVVDEHTPRQTDGSKTTHTEPTAPAPLPSLNSDTDTRDTSWGQFAYGESPYEPFYGGRDNTPPHSRHPLLHSQPSIPTFDPDPPRSQTPQADHATNVPLPT
jgi:hypothetical protein